MTGQDTGPQITAALLHYFADATPEEKPALLAVLGSRSGSDVQKLLRESAADKNDNCRLVALNALVDRQDIPLPERLQIFQDALPKAASDAERRIFLRGLEHIPAESSLPLLRNALKREATRNEAYAAMLPLSILMDSGGDRKQAIALCTEIAERATDPQVAWQALGQLKAFGVPLDLLARQGFVHNWWLLGPIEGRKPWKNADAFPIAAGGPVSRPVTVNKSVYNWKFVDVNEPSGVVNLNRLLEGRDEAAAYAWAEVNCKAAQDVWFKMSADDDLVCWLNDKKIHQRLGDFACKIDENVVPAHLQQGTNRILLKILNGSGDWAFVLRITDRSGKPLTLEQHQGRN